ANTCDLLILNGDIVDGWQLKKRGKWKKKHTRFFKEVLKNSQKNGSKVIYLRGNHDDFLDNVVPLYFGGLSFVQDYIYESNGKRYLITHGDIFDSITKNMKWLAKLGDIGYNILLWYNKIYNRKRQRKGLSYVSISKKIKAQVKKAVSYISNYEKELVKIAQMKNCQGIICGHIHQPAIANYDGVVYMNSGDWVESLTALVETDKGKWKIVYYEDEVQKELS
ncbi:UDP-2,3-diacylglucosamine diphosphatase, partial [Bacteroidota bacterium]